MASSEDRARALAEKINEAAKEAKEAGVKEAYGVAGVAILTCTLIVAIERIERLEGDIKLLTEMLANVEAKQ